MRRSWHRVPVVRFALAVVAVTVVTSCSTTDTSTEPSEATEAERAADVLREYAAAISRQDIEAVMDLRCDEQQIDDAEVDLFAEQVRQLVERTGELAIGTVRDGSDIAPIDGLVAYSFEGFDGVLTAAVRSEDGGDVLCFWRPEASFDIGERAERELVDLGPTDTPPSELFPATPGDGFEPVDTPTLPGASDGSDRASGADSSESRAWQTEAFGGVTITVGSYADAAAALEDAARFSADAAADGVDTIEPASSPDVVAIRALGYAWLLAQAPSVPPYVDRAVLPFGSTLVTVDVAGLEPERSAEVLGSTVAEVLRRAGR